MMKNQEETNLSPTAKVIAGELHGELIQKHAFLVSIARALFDSILIAGLLIFTLYWLLHIPNTPQCIKSIYSDQQPVTYVPCPYSYHNLWRLGLLFIVSCVSSCVSSLFAKGRRFKQSAIVTFSLITALFFMSSYTNFGFVEKVLLTVGIFVSMFLGYRFSFRLTKKTLS